MDFFLSLGKHTWINFLHNKTPWKGVDLILMASFTPPPPPPYGPILELSFLDGWSKASILFQNELDAESFVK
jgi:hypothetical protein